MRSFRPLREWPRAVSARRLVLLATVAGLGVAGAAVGPNVFHQANLPTYATANAEESMQRPAGFADLVGKVKPAVISVRVKMDAGAEMMGFDGDRPLPPNSHMQRFFHHFGMPNDKTTPDNQRQPNGHFMMAQGSGFFITADGYAVTNNHVVDKAKAVEITTDDGKLMMPRWSAPMHALILPSSRWMAAVISRTSSLRKHLRVLATGLSQSAIRSALVGR